MERHGYRRIRTIGEGGFGQAVLCEKGGQQWVVKEINMTSFDRAKREACINEIKVLRSVEHPNIVKYQDHFTSGAHLYIVMEYCDCGDVAELIQKRRSGFPEDMALHYFVQICLALKHLHDRNILHRDLKSENVFLSERRHLVKLGDFGRSAILRDAFSNAKTLCGTPFFWSPEECKNLPYNHKSDIWSLGCLLYEMCTANMPFDAPNHTQLMQVICAGQFRQLPGTFSSDLRNLVATMLSHQPEKRPSIDEILRAPFLRQKMKDIIGRNVNAPAARDAKPEKPLPAPEDFGMIPGAAPPVRGLAQAPQAGAGGAGGARIGGAPQMGNGFGMPGFGPAFGFGNAGLGKPSQPALPQQRSQTPPPGWNAGRMPAAAAWPQQAPVQAQKPANASPPAPQARHEAVSPVEASPAPSGGAWNRARSAGAPALRSAAKEPRAANATPTPPDDGAARAKERHDREQRRENEAHQRAVDHSNERRDNSAQGPARGREGGAYGGYRPSPQVGQAGQVGQVGLGGGLGGHGHGHGHHAPARQGGLPAQGFGGFQGIQGGFNQGGFGQGFGGLGGQHRGGHGGGHAFGQHGFAEGRGHSGGHHASGDRGGRWAKDAQAPIGASPPPRDPEYERMVAKMRELLAQPAH